MKNKKLLFFLLTFFLVITVFSGWVYISLNKNYYSEDKKEVLFKVSQGDGVQLIAEDLQKEGIIENSFIFTGYVFLSNKKGSLQAGTYKIEPGMSVIDIVELFSSGDVVFETITIIEGWSLLDISNYFEEKGITTRDEFFNSTGISSEQADLIGIKKKLPKNFSDFKILRDKPEESSLEGYLFPDTYKIPFESEADDVLKVVIANFEDKAYNIVKDSEDIHKIIIMASLLEKEVVSFEDKRKVSDILWRRLEVGMPLQIDATVNYVTGKRGIDVTTKETQVDSLYNTYQYKGLPKGPISNPGIESIKATLDPLENNYWYYLSNPETGKTIFSRNHEEHVQAKNKYLR